uniref:Dynamin N-terminal domain-containing protein n=2 Tax=Neogobius melanostomus TaxID=47308 RepID=A0A8C6UUD0_9GOBI
MIMSHVDNKLSEICEQCDDDNDNNKKVIDFLRELMQNLNKEKKELVGVFGKTGAGKSSLINAVIGEEDLLPTGTSRACTSVIIKVEGNTENQKYVAIVEFISREELEDLLLSTKHLFVTSSGKKEKVDAESKDNSDRMTALFGNDWRDVPYETFMCGEKYRKMSTSIKKTQRFQCDSSSTLSQKLVDFTKNIRNPSSPLYWPVVKCVTIKVPNNHLLNHVTLVDLPGTGDRNKTRKDMWKEMLSSCGTVWIVTDMTRPESDEEPWKILQSACSIMGNGGECRNIRFICTKADQCLDELSPEDTKAGIIQEFQAEVQNHFPEDGFKVSIVSTKEEIMPPEKNEISDLEEFLESLNNPEERVQRYVSDAYGILALMMGARSQNAQQKTAVFNKLTDGVKEEIKKISTQMEPVHEIFERILTEGVNLAKQQWESALDEKVWYFQQ